MKQFVIFSFSHYLSLAESLENILLDGKIYLTSLKIFNRSSEDNYVSYILYTESQITVK